MNSEIEYSLNELCEQADVTVRTVRYYVRQGLLDSPGVGRGARYKATHLERLRLIRALQAEHLPLAAIRKRLDVMSDEDIRTSVVAESDAGSAKSTSNSAADYVRSVLDGGNQPGAISPSPLRFERASGPPQSSIPATGGVLRRATWERVQITADIEVHIRRPLTRADNRRIDKLLATAEQLFNKDRRSS